MSSTSCEGHIGILTTVGGAAPVSEVDHVNLLSENLRTALFLSSDYSDVSLVVEGIKFPAHRIILAARSEFFRALLFGGMRETTECEVRLEAASTASFKVLLKYVYTGKLSLGELKEDVILDVLGLCHQWGFEELEGSVCEFLQKALHVGNVCAILDTAIVFGLTSLANTCCVFADTNAMTLMEHPTFLNLSPAGVTELITRDSFCADEEKIFEFVAEWVRHNQETHPDAKKVLTGIRLPLMKIEVLLEKVRPTNMVGPDSILDAIQCQKQAKATDLRYRGYLMPEENVAHMKHGAVVLKGEPREYVLDGDCQNYDVERGFTRHIIDDKDENKGAIVIKLRQQCILNHIRLLLWDRDLRSYSYYVEVSMNQEDWVRICDHQKYHCRSWQNIFFPERVIRYIKIVGTHNTVNRMFHIVQVQAFFTRKDFNIHPTFGLLCPTENVATIEMSACVIEGVSRSRNALINGETRGYDWDSGYTCHQLGSGAIVVQLAQPYVLSSMRLLLWDCDDRSYSYYIEVSTNQRNWEMVCNRSREKCKSWQMIKFKSQPVVYIRIVGTDNTANEVFHCVHFECPAQVEDDSDSEEGPDKPAADATVEEPGTSSGTSSSRAGSVVAQLPAHPTSTLRRSSDLAAEPVNAEPVPNQNMQEFDDMIDPDAIRHNAGMNENDLLD